MLYSLQVYWTSIFILPKKVINAIEQKFNSFCGMGRMLRLQKQKWLGMIFVFLRKRVVWG
jgi:hypothetical protein